MRSSYKVKGFSIKNIPLRIRSFVFGFFQEF
jgi:hypothetical protein